MEISEIKDRESLQAWLEALPQETEAEREEARRWAVAIAHRAAMRLFPLFFHWEDQQERPIDASDIAIFRIFCIVAVASREDGSEIHDRAIEARHLSLRLNGQFASLKKVEGPMFVLGSISHVLTAILSPDFSIYAAHAAQFTYFNLKFNSLEAFKSDDSYAFQLVRSDCTSLSNGDALDRRPLWDGDNALASLWAETRPQILAQGEGWRFWVDWYDNALHGRPQDYDLLTKIALIDPEDWDKGADHVNALIAQIVQVHRPGKNDKVAEIAADSLIRAAIGNFTFDAMAEVMRIVPFAEDIRFMRDRNALKRVMDDVGAIRDQLETFQQAMERRSHTQGCAGDIAAYLKSILSEFDRAKSDEELRVGNIIEYGGILQYYCLDESARAELRPLDKALERHVSALLDVTHRHFASTFLRFEPLQALELGEDDPHEMLLQVRDRIRALSSASKDDISPLDRAGWAMINAMADDLERYIRAHFTASDPRVVDSLRREVTFKMAQLQVSLALYVVKGREQAQTLGKIADKLVTVDNRVTTVSGLWTFLKEWLTRG